MENRYSSIMSAACFGANILDPRRFATLRLAALRGVRWAALFAGIVASAWTAPARAVVGEDVFTVLDVYVDATAENAAAARDLALSEGHANSFRRLLARLVPDAERRRMPPLVAADIAQLIRDFSVDEEKTSSVRYLATLRVRFKQGAVRRLLRGADIPFAETRSKPVLVLPVYRRAGALLLWDQANGWRHAWAALPPSDGLLPMILPKGGLADINDIGPEQALRGDRARIRAIAGRYGAADILLAVARLGRDPATNAVVLHVDVSRFGAAGQGHTVVRSFSARAGESVGALLAGAARAVRTEIEESWKRDNLLHFGDRHWLTAVTPLNRLKEWVEMRRHLARVAFVQASDLLSLSRTEATVRLSFIGDEEQLILALAQRDLRLARGPVSWVLQFGSSAPGGGPKPAVVE